MFTIQRISGPEKLFIFIECEILYEKIEREITNYILDLILCDSIMEDTPKISKFIYGLSYLTKLMERQTRQYSHESHFTLIDATKSVSLYYF